MRFISAVFLLNSAAGEPCQSCAAKRPIMDCQRHQVPPEDGVKRFSQFVGLLTEVRDKYFRRLLCHNLGSEIKRSLFPDNLSSIGPMVLGMGRFSDKRFFQFKPAINPEARP